MSSYRSRQLSDSNAIYSPSSPAIGRPFSPTVLFSGRNTPRSTSPASPFRRLATPDPVRVSSLSRTHDTTLLRPQTPDTYFRKSDYSGFQEVNPDTFEAWFSAAQKATDEFMTKGSSTPIAWVLVQWGECIPPSAVAAGHDRSDPLYIARAFYEGGIYPGYAKSGGAVIPYNSREIQVDIFEVLVANLTPRWGPHPQPVQSPPLHFPNLRHLSEVKTVIVIDDSTSVFRPLWNEVREAVVSVVVLAQKHHADGIDIYFLTSRTYGADMTTGSAVRSLFGSVVPDDETTTGEKLSTIWTKYIPEDGRMVKPLNLIVMTDSPPTGNLLGALIDVTRLLDQLHVRNRQLAIQLSQVGNNKTTAEHLTGLHSALIAGLKNIVRVTSFNKLKEGHGFVYRTLLEGLSGNIRCLLDTSSTQSIYHPALSRLRGFKTVILVDDSSSMFGTLWDDTRDALAALVDLCTQYGVDGVDVYFMNNPTYYHAVKSSQAVRNLFSAVVPEGQTPTGEKLGQILKYYFPDIGRIIHPMNVIVITDGVPTDDLSQVLITTAQHLDQIRVPDFDVKVHFLQVGDDPRAAEYLSLLSSSLPQVGRMMHMVNATPYDQYDRGDLRFTEKNLVKVLLGALDTS